MNSEDEKVYGELKARAAIPVEEDGLLWHYTSWEGLKGIVENRELWASHIAYLNDSEELAHGLKLLAEMIDERSHLPHLEQLKESLLPERRDETLNRIETYTVSFSHKFDDLAQWRGYSGLGSRFAIGFNPAVLERVGYLHSFDLKECLYTNQQKRDAYSVVLGFIEEQAKNLDIPAGDERGGFSPRQVAHRSYGKMVGVVQHFYAANVAARMKDESFKDEEEFRLIAKELHFDASIIPNAARRDYRTKGALVVPYVRLRIPADAEPLLVQPFTAVIVGPQAHRKLARGAVERLLRDQHVSAPVVESKVPFRDW
jgi:hypothetical protein